MELNESERKLAKSGKDSCAFIQNYQLLLDEIPISLKNLDYAVYPNNENIYNHDRFIYNKLLNYFPHAIFYPKSTNNVSFLIIQFVKYKLNFAIRNGGHAYEPASLSNGYILDVTKLPSYVIISNDRKTAKISSGFLLGNLVKKLSESSLITPTGTHSCVGLSGLGLAGGKGLLSRLYGLTCENIVSLKMINYKGELISINNNERTDLLWACKGAGAGNFGIITEIELKVYEDIFCELETFTWEWNTTLAKELLIMYQLFVENLPNSIGSEFTIIYNNSIATIIIKFFIFNHTTINTDIFKNKNNPSYEYYSGYYSKLTPKWLNLSTGNEPPFSKIKSSMIFKPTITKEGIDLLVNSINYNLEKKLKLNYQLNINQLSGQVEKGNSAYFPKKAKFIISYFIQWTNPDLTEYAKKFLKNIYQKMLPYTSIYCFPNLIDYDIKNYMEQYYGSNKKRLKEIKKKYDPENIFKYRQSIR
jgi:hypothetical protein